MNEDDLMVAPPRLIEGDDEIGRALRERQEVWDAQQRRAQPSRAQFAALSAKRERRLLLRSGLGMSAAAVALLGVTSLGHFLLQSTDGQRLLAAPDKMLVSPIGPKKDEHQHHDSVGTRGVVPAPSPVVAPPPAHGWPSDEQSKGTPPLRSFVTPGNADSRAAPRGGRSAQPDGELSRLASNATPSGGSPQRVYPSVAHEQGQDCRPLSYVEARACYTQKSEGRGITAELAYLERARLEQKQGKDAAAALRSLTEYQRRFPEGTLQPEATLARIRLLVSTHQNPEARAAIAQALPRMPEKAAQLRAVALELAVAAGECAEAGQLLKQIPAEVATPAWKAAHLGICAKVDR